MFRGATITFLFFLMAGLNCQAEGIKFFKGSWEEALTKAEAEGKMIFVDAYTTWCGPCKMMSKKVFTQDEVGQFFNNNFINLKLDMEKEESTSFKRSYSVDAFPTLFFISEQNELVKKGVGAKQAEALLAMAKDAIKNNDQSGKYEEAYIAGDRSYALVYDYVKALNNAGKPSAKVANEYLRSRPEITREERAAFLFEACQSVDSRLFDLMIEEKKLILDMKDKEAFDEKVISSAWNTVGKAVKYETYEIVEEAIKKVKEHHSSKAKLFSYEAALEYCAQQRLREEYKTNSAKYFKKIAKKDAKILKGLVNQIIENFNRDEDMAAHAISFAERLVKLDESEINFMTLSKVLFTAGKKQEALENAQKGLELLKKNEEPTKQIERYIKYIEQRV